MSLSFHSKASSGRNYSNTVKSSPPSKSATWLVDLAASSASSYSTRSTSFNKDSASGGSYATATAYTGCTSRGTHSFARRSWSSSNSSDISESRMTESSALFSDEDESASDGNSRANSQSRDNDDDDNNNDDKKKEAAQSEPRLQVALVNIAAALDKLQWRHKILSESDRKQPNHTTQNNRKKKNDSCLMIA